MKPILVAAYVGATNKDGDYTVFMKENIMFAGDAVVNALNCFHEIAPRFHKTIESIKNSGCTSIISSLAVGEPFIMESGEITDGISKAIIYEPEIS